MAPAIYHTIRIFLYLFVFTAILNLVIEGVGTERLSELLLGNTILQPIIAALIGLIPNCAASVMLTQLYLTGAISFASVIAGLSSGAGVGLVVLFRINKDKRESLIILGVLFIASACAGTVLQIGS